MPLKIALLLLTLFLLNTSAFAHVSGVTDTNVKIQQSKVSIVFTTPMDNLEELNLKSEEAIQKFILGGFRVENNDLPCINTLIKTGSLETIKSRQFWVTSTCDEPIKSLLIGYDLFFELEDKHKNFLRISLLNRSLNITFTANKKEHVIPVESILKIWNKNKQANQQTSAETFSSQHYFPVGVEHILLGFDHLLFLLALLLLPIGFKELIGLVTSFTIAHSITLGLSVLDIVSLPVALVEIAIALSIVYVAIENIVVIRNKPSALRLRIPLRRRLITTFAFGLIHGFGFSYILKELGLGEQVFGSSLFFNLGVEAGQLIAIALVFPVLIFLFKHSSNLKWAQLASFMVGVVGLFWLIERCAGLV